MISIKFLNCLTIKHVSVCVPVCVCVCFAKVNLRFLLPLTSKSIINCPLFVFASGTSKNLALLYDIQNLISIVFL